MLSNTKSQEDNIIITKQMDNRQLKHLPNWKRTGHDGIHEFWLKQLSNLKPRMAIQLNECLQEKNMPVWMTTDVIIKDTENGAEVSNF